MARTVRSSFVLGLATGAGIIAAAFFAGGLRAQLLKSWNPETLAPVLYCYPPQEKENVFPIPFPVLPEHPALIRPSLECYQQQLVEDREFSPYE